MLLVDFINKKDEFVTYIELEKNFSSHTQKAYKNDLEQFILFWQMLSKKEDFDLTLKQVLERFFVALYNKNVAKSSIARKISCFQSFDKFLKKYGINLKLNLKRPRIDKKLPIYLSIDEVFYLLDTIENRLLPTKKPYRDKAIFELLYATGVRCSELVMIKIADIDFEHKLIRITGKGKKERLALFGEKAKNVLNAYITAERGSWSDTQERLFLNYRNEPLTTRSVQRIIEMFRSFLHIKRALTPHKLRHSFATHLLNQKTDLRVVQELLGHRTLASTEKYTHVTDYELSELYDAIHPFNTFGKKGNKL